MAGKDVEKIDLNNKVVLPAFIDAHFHVLSTAQISLFDNVGLKRFKSIDKALSYMREAANKTESEWLLFRNLDLSTQTWKKSTFTREDADLISESMPVFIWHAGGHKATCNSKMLQILGRRPTEDGVLSGTEIFGALAKIEPYAKWEPVVGLKKAYPKWLSMGLGTLGDAGTGPVTEGSGDLDVLFKAA